MLSNYDSTSVEKRVKSKTLNKKFILAVATKVQSYLDKPLLKTETDGLIHFIKSIDYNKLKNKPPDAIIDVISRNFIRRMMSKVDYEIDTHEMLKRSIGAIRHDGSESLFAEKKCAPFGDHMRTMGARERGLEGFGTRARNTEETERKYVPEEEHNNITDLLELEGKKTAEETTQLENKAVPFSSKLHKYPRIAKQKIQNVYLLLDSKYRNLSTDISVFKWTVLHSANTTQGTVNTLSDQIHNIINVQFDKTFIPYTESADNVYQKITLFIEEFASMSVLLNNRRRYHMLFDAEITGSRIGLTPLVNDEGRFRFHTPLNVLDSLTLRFNNPFSPVTFLPDRYSVTVTSLNPTQSLLNFTEDHKVADGERVHLEEYSTLAPVADITQINLINAEEGHIVTFIDNTTLRIEVSLTSVTHDATNLTKCFIATRRIIIPIRLEYIM